MTFDFPKQKFNEKLIENGIRMIIEGIGDDPDRDGVKETPARVSRMYKKILNGYDDEQDITKYIKLFDQKTNGQMVVMKDIFYWTFCEHHFTLISGKLHIAYIPASDKVLGISKLIRIARIFSKKLQIQERLTKEIADAISNNVPNNGVAIKMEMTHHCCSLRGVRSPDAKTVTSYLTGKFEQDEKTRHEFLEALK